MSPPKEDGICGCIKPVELPDMGCGQCGRRRIGNDLTPGQITSLAAALAKYFGLAERTEPRQRLTRCRGRKRQRSERAI